MIEHTCIKDDGGNPGRRCYACEAEKTQGSPCKFPGCIAQSNTGRDHCTIHYPENVAYRAIEIITKAFWPLTNRKMMFVEAGKATDGVQRHLSRTRDRIIDEIKRTT